MFIENRTAKVAIISLLVLLLIPLLVMLGMMAFGTGMMAQMGGTMGSGGMALCILWSVLVAAALVFLIFLLGRGPGHRVAS